jgi:hypothetical protein
MPGGMYSDVLLAFFLIQYNERHLSLQYYDLQDICFIIVVAGNYNQLTPVGRNQTENEQAQGYATGNT